MTRLEKDVYFYFDPDTFIQISKRVLPVMGTMIDFKRAADGIIRYISEDDYDEDKNVEKDRKSISSSESLRKI